MRKWTFILLLATLACPMLATSTSGNPEGESCKVILKTAEEDATKVTVENVKPGMLAEVVGDRKLTMTSLSVSGVIDAADVEFLWEATYYGKLTGINLGNTEITGGALPEKAFLHPDVQLNADMTLTPIKLQLIKLPKNLK